MLREVKLKEDELPGVNAKPGTLYGKSALSAEVSFTLYSCFASFTWRTGQAVDRYELVLMRLRDLAPNLARGILLPRPLWDFPAPLLSVPLSSRFNCLG